jgi:multiple sugar transport system substrate-binding protein
MRPMRACAEAWEQAGRGRLEWSTRSLEAFGDQPLDGLAPDYDLLVIDHPFCGASAGESLVPIEALVDADTLLRLRRSAIGPTQRSYESGGVTWALAVDAACQVSAVAGRDRPLPAAWPEAVSLVRSLGVRAALPLAPAHAISSLLTLWAGAGLDPLAGGVLVDRERGLEPLEWLSEMHRSGPESATRWEPPDALRALTQGEIDYVPLTYGYVTYSRRAGTGRDCRFVDIPGTRGAVLGGAGIAVSAFARHPLKAAEFAAWACGETAQVEIVARQGGQPASRACWEDEALDAQAGGFYGATRATIDAAWIRPREWWWPRFQLTAGRVLTAGLDDREPPARILTRLIDIHDRLAHRSAQLT